MTCRAEQLFDHQKLLTVPMNELHSFRQRIQEFHRDLAMNKIHMSLFVFIVNPLTRDVKSFLTSRAADG